MNEIDFLATEIKNRYGTIKRARSCFLYTQKNIRLTDMFQESGRAILGWGGSSSFTVLKNVLNRGLTGSFETDFMPRLNKAVSELLFSSRKVFIFHSKLDALSAGVSIFPNNTSVWKPWSSSKDSSVSWSNVDCVVIEPPLAWTQGIYLLAVLDKDTKGIFLSDEAEKNTIKLSAPILAAVTRSLYDVISAIQVRSEKDWFTYDTVLCKYWERKGPYLYPKVPKDKYKDFIIHCLDLGIVISPVYENPSIVPFGADKGVFTCLKNNPFTT